MSFAAPAVWREPVDHVSDCYFCLAQVQGFSRKSKLTVQYPKDTSVQLPVPHCVELPVPSSTRQHIDSSTGSDEPSTSCNDESTPYRPATAEPHLVTQAELNELARDLALSKQRAEVLASRLREWNLRSPDARISSFRSRSAQFSGFFTKTGLPCHVLMFNDFFMPLNCIRILQNGETLHRCISSNPKSCPSA